MTYRERRARKAERLREWAGKREAKADAANQREHQLLDPIPPGQPILVGHHSERGHRRALDRADNARRAARDSAEKADDFRRRADNIDAAAERAIYSDDDDAAEKLRERIAEMEAERARIKAYNASCRKGARDMGLLDEAQQAKLASTAQHAPYQLGKNGAAPAYWLSNLGGNIGRLRKRLAQLEANGGEPRERTITARYDGACADCGTAIERGQTIRYSRAEGARCAQCNGGGEE